MYLGVMEEDSSEKQVVFTDDSGNEYSLIKLDGIFFSLPNNMGRTFHENTKKLHHLKVCESDVIILGFPKSGTHWVYEMVGMLLNGTTETVARVKEVFMLDTQPIDNVNSLPPPRILNSHYRPKYLPLDVLAKCKLVYLLRNPKDIVVSHYNVLHKRRRFPGNFDDYLGLFMNSKVPYGSWFEYVRSYEEFFEEHPDLNPLMLYYEDIHVDPVAAVKKLAEHLNVDYPEEFYIKIAEECHIDKMKVNNVAKRHDFTAGDSVDGTSPMYRKGKVGDWKNWFTVAANERLDAMFKEKMKGSKLKFKFEL